MYLCIYAESSAPNISPNGAQFCSLIESPRDNRPGALQSLLAPRRIKRSFILFVCLLAEYSSHWIHYIQGHHGTKSPISDTRHSRSVSAARVKPRRRDLAHRSLSDWRESLSERRWSNSRRRHSLNTTGKN